MNENVSKYDNEFLGLYKLLKIHCYCNKKYEDDKTIEIKTVIVIQNRLKNKKDIPLTSINSKSDLN